MRDPRTDPRAGDLLSKPQKGRRPLLRQILHVDGRTIFYCEALVGQVPGRWKQTRADLARRWAKGAEVLMRGEE